MGSEMCIRDSISAEERIEAVERSTNLLVANDVEARTVEVTAALVNKVDESKLLVLSVDEVEETLTTSTVLDKIEIHSLEESEGSEKTTDTGERITEDEVATIEVDESTLSATLLLSDGSKIEVRIGEDGELVTSDGQTLEVKLDPETQQELERLYPKQIEADQTLEDTADKKPEFSDDSALNDTDSKDPTPKSEGNGKTEPSTSLDSSKQETESTPPAEPKAQPSTEQRAPSFESDSTKR